MRRIACREREDWRSTAEACGFDFHTIDGERYWDERGYYAFSLDEIELQIETPTGEIDAMCLELVARTIDDERYLRRLKIPEAFWPLLSQSWHRDEPSLYGRIDLSFDGRGAARLLEYNADTPRSSRRRCFNGVGSSRRSSGASRPLTPTSSTRSTSG
jgi:glutathionylspermidine synthase